MELAEDTNSSLAPIYQKADTPLLIASTSYFRQLDERNFGLYCNPSLIWYFIIDLATLTEENAEIFTTKGAYMQISENAYISSIDFVELDLYVYERLNDKFLSTNVLLDGDVPQSDWNQNDETALDYVKNRTHYIEVVEESIDIAGLEYAIEFECNGSTLLVTEHNLNIPISLGQVWSCTLGSRTDTLYVCVADDGTLFLSPTSGYTSFGRPSIYDIGTNTAHIAPAYGSAFGTSAVLTGVSGTATVKTEDVHKLDTKYLPDDISVQSDWNEADETALSFIKNKPEIATDEEIIEMLTQEDMFPVVTDSDGSILADENENILLW